MSLGDIAAAAAADENARFDERLQEAGVGIAGWVRYTDVRSGEGVRCLGKPRRNAARNLLLYLHN